MKNIIILALAIASVLALSGCSAVKSDGLSIRLSADPSPVFSGSSTVVSIDVDNRNDKSINDVVVKLFDTGVLRGQTCGAVFPRLLPQEFQTISCRLDAPLVNDSIGTEINVIASFASTFSASQTFEVLSESEYNRRRSVGFMQAPKTYTYGDRYVRLDVEFSEAPPLVIAPDKKYFVYLTITNVGDGFLKDIVFGELRLDVNELETPPMIIQCPDITVLTPAGKRFPRLACDIPAPQDYFAVRSFKTSGFIVSLDYQYELRDSLKIQVIK